MTDNIADLDALTAESESFFAQARALLADIEKAREEQPAKLAAMREAAERAHTETLAAEPWSEAWSALPMTDAETGELTGMMSLPSIDGKELWGARAAFDFLDASGDRERVEACLNRYFTALDGNVEHLFFVFSAALCCIAEDVVPALLNKLETSASDYRSRVLFADAARNAWATRLNDPRGPLADPDQAAER